jgi:hypothetical protein
MAKPTRKKPFTKTVKLLTAGLREREYIIRGEIVCKYWR